MLPISSGAKDRLTEAFFKALEKKHYSRITVSRLIKSADVSRTTFYRYYDDIFDMYDKICTEFIEKFIKTVLSDSLKTSGRYDFAFFEKLQNTLCSQNHYIMLLIGENGDRRFFERVIEIAGKSMNNLNKAMSNESVFRLKFVIYAGIGTYIESNIKNEKLPLDVLEISKKVLGI